ncbi:NAD(P)-binding protein [Mycena sanguinolenta]|uniref:NAD(P)-binding protein n=1 Tax=Mycena sanguinolenta TaxID=230812 RepID=A0A8H7CHE8_9AGAR|nr:NAD(P)-binding protein [Mycena sanguinolenta]
MPSYVVTGAAKGIGLEFVTQLSADSENAVFAIVRNKTTATQLEALSRNNITILEADVTDAKALQLAANEVSRATDGKLDYLINNAGKSNHPGLALDDFPNTEALEHDLIDVFKTNTIGAIHSTNAFLPLLKNGLAKKVVSITSVLGDPEVTVSTEAIGQVSYSISKAALNMVVAKYAAQYKAEGFTFLAIAPGFVQTSLMPAESEAPGEIRFFERMLSRLSSDYKGLITPEESVKLQLDVIYSWPVEKSGAFVSQFGNKEWF